MQLAVRKATQKDIKDIQLLNLKLFKKEHKQYDSTLNLEWTFGIHGTKYFKQRINSNNSLVLIASINKTIVGYLIANIRKVPPYRNINNIAEIENMFVEKRYRGNGIGRKMVEEFFAWAKSKGVKFTTVTAFAKNKLALKFYQKLGFIKREITMEKNITQN